MKKLIFMTLTAASTSFAPAQTTSKDEQAIRNITATMQRGWNEKNGNTFASVFDKVHNYIVINGMYFSSITPEINANAHQEIFNSIYKTTDLEYRVDKVTFVRPDLALVYAFAALYEHGTSIPENPKAIISMVVEKKQDEWKVISFHNCPIEMFESGNAGRSPIPLNVMYAGWYKK